MAKKEINEYLKEVRKIYMGKDYTEMTFRTAFENLIRKSNPDYNLIHEPKRKTGLGAPDYKAFLGSANVGYIETKDLGENLDNVMESKQMEKYIENIDNIILTDYARFILVGKGKEVIDFNLFTKSDLDKSSFTISDEKIDTFNQLMDEFFGYKLLTIKDAEELARELAKKAKLLKDIVMGQLKEDIVKTAHNEIPSPLYDFYLGIKSLINDISIEDSADAYAQTVTYSLFLARKNSQEGIDRVTAYSHIPENIGILKRMFINMSVSEFPSNISWIIDDIVDVLNVTSIDEVFTTIDKRSKKDKDPILFLYEDFIYFYEPEKKKKLGVYYTPRPIVNFIVNSTHWILKTHFNKPTGFADDSVTVLDPAAGTGTFFWITFLVVLNELRKQGLRGLIDEKIQKHLLKHFYGLELLITPYVIAHLKLSDILQSWHYKFKESDRIQIYLTNTLEPSKEEQIQFLPFLREIALENIATAKIKSKDPIISIIGNPPYAGMSANKGKWIDDKLKKGYTRADGSRDDGYYKVNGEKLGERNPKWLQDDYVKFIRFAQWKIDKNGEGVIGFITNHSYLDNPTFRGMRESLLDSFNRIYVLNLHGSALKQEKCPDGSKDENVFDIKQGVAISIFIKNSEFKDKKIFYTDLWGLRDFKYNWLDRHIVNNVTWQEIEPISPFYFFVPKDTSLLKEYENYWSIKEIFPENSIGIVTGRDGLTVQWTAEDVSRVIHDFADLEPENARTKYRLKKDARDWKVKLAQKDLKSSGLDENNIVPILYRPFDVRYTYYTGKSRGFHCMPRDKVMTNMLQSNLALSTCRQQIKTGFQHVFVTDKIAVSDIVSNKSKEVSYVFPLYIYSDAGDTSLNFSTSFLEFIHKKYGNSVAPEEIFYYIYAILHSPKYRERYAELLQFDFPRIPFVDYNKFKELSEIGEYLIDLHLMRKTLPIKTKFDVEGSNVVENVVFRAGKVWINDEQYFDAVPPVVYNFHIGGYKVLDKWLKYRKNKQLTKNEIENFLQMVEIIKITIVSMKKIDDVLY